MSNNPRCLYYGFYRVRLYRCDGTAVSARLRLRTFLAASEKKRHGAHQLPRTPALLRLSSAGEKGADEDDPGMARAFRHQYDEQYLQPSGRGEQTRIRRHHQRGSLIVKREI